MTKIRNLIEKIWWVIPPIIVVSLLPFLIAVRDTIKYSQPISAFFLNFVKYLYLITPMYFTDWLLGLIGALGVMGLGYYLVRKKSSLFLRIIIPTILAGIGFFAGIILLSMMYMH